MAFFQERRFPRIEFHQVPWVFTLRLSDPVSSDKPLRLEARNISRGGLKFYSNRRFTLFEVLQIHLLEKTTGKPLLPLQGKVVRVEEIETGYGERTYGIAMEFAAGIEALSILPGPSENTPPGK
jgi:hypothetical protein